MMRPQIGALHTVVFICRVTVDWGATSFFNDKNWVSVRILLNFNENESNICLMTDNVFGVITTSKLSRAWSITYVADLSTFSDSNRESSDPPEKIDEIKCIHFNKFGRDNIFYFVSTGVMLWQKLFVPIYIQKWIPKQLLGYISDFCKANER